MDIFDKPITFTKRKSPLPPDMRPIWRVSIIVLLLSLFGRAGKASEMKIHFLIYVIRNKNKWNTLKRVILENELPLDLIIRFDPSVNRALMYSQAEGLLKYEKTKNVVLTDKGKEFSKLILSNEDLFSDEKAFLKNFKKNDFPDKRIESIMKLDYISR